MIHIPFFIAILYLYGYTTFKKHLVTGLVIIEIRLAKCLLYLSSMMEFILLFPLLLRIFEIFQKKNNPYLAEQSQEADVKSQRMSLD